MIRTTTPAKGPDSGTGLSEATSNGEVEGPDDHAGQRPRARNIDWVPRPQTTHASRPPPTIVRAHAVKPGFREPRSLRWRDIQTQRKPHSKSQCFRLPTRRG